MILAIPFRTVHDDWDIYDVRNGEFLLFHSQNDFEIYMKNQGFIKDKNRERFIKKYEFFLYEKIEFTNPIDEVDYDKYLKGIR